MFDWLRAGRREQPVSLADFEVLGKLGESKLGFGKLVLVKRKPKGRLFAMKVSNWGYWTRTLFWDLSPCICPLKTSRFRVLDRILGGYLTGWLIA